jgi:hypothetical protein
MNPLRAVRVEYLTMLKKSLTAEIGTYFMFKFYFLSAHKPLPRQVALVVLSALTIIFHNNSRPVGFPPTHKRSAYSSNISEEHREGSFTSTTSCTQMIF